MCGRRRLVRGTSLFSPPDDIYSSAAWLRVSLAGGDNEWFSASPGIRSIFNTRLQVWQTRAVSADGK